MGMGPSQPTSDRLPSSSQKPGGIHLPEGACSRTMAEGEVNSNIVALRPERWLLPIPVDKFYDESRNLNVEYRLLLHLAEAHRLSGNSTRPRRTTSKDLCPSVVPNEEHRVPLPGVECINASMMPTDFGRLFIAAQGPSKSTVRDFWHMVAHHRVRQVVMLCGVEECAEYLPKEDGPLAWGREEDHGAVKMVRESSDFLGIERCTLEVCVGQEHWEVEHVRCPGWPDNGAPPLEEILRLLQIVCGRSGPVVVHCRAGVGRTGCFISLCGLVARASRDLVQCPSQVPRVSVLQTVLDVRAHRPGMVGTLEQYQSLYEILKVVVGRFGLGFFSSIVSQDSFMSTCCDSDAESLQSV